MKQDLYCPEYFPDIPSKSKPIKRFINQTVLFILGRALQYLSKQDKAIQDEISIWPDDLILLMLILPQSGAMAVQRTPECQLVYLGDMISEQHADIVISIKNVEAGFRMLTGQMGTDVAYARHQIAVKGDISLTVSITRVINRVETYLFPAFLARKLMKRLPKIPFLKKQFLRLKTYFLGVPFGI
jgi:hypothetical protein